MSGSIKWFNYTGDNGTLYATQRDESNGEAVLNTVAVLANLTAAAVLLPGRLRMRYVNTFLSTDPLRKKRFFIGTLAAFNAISGATNITEAGTPALVWTVTSKRGETAPIPSVADTGQIDGDAN